MSPRRLRFALACAAATAIAPPPTKLNVRFATADDFKAIASLRTSIFSSHLTSLYSKIEQDRLFVDTMSKKSAVVAAVRPTDGAYLGCADVGREELPGRGVTACYVTSVCVEQLGTGVVLPTRSEWGWLGITITPEGDVYVADTDQSCLHLV